MISTNFTMKNNCIATIERFYFSGVHVNAFVPDSAWIQQQKSVEPAAGLYWARVWPAAIALCELIAANTVLVKDKRVLELAAGLGLPSLLSAQWAAQVTATDKFADAVEMMNQSARYAQLKNLQCCLMDWNEAANTADTEVLLLSDINYDPQNFTSLYNMLDRFISKGTTVLLSTPQRLMAKPFMESISKWLVKTYEQEIIYEAEKNYVSVWLLQKS